MEDERLLSGRLRVDIRRAESCCSQLPDMVIGGQSLAHRSGKMISRLSKSSRDHTLQPTLQLFPLFFSQEIAQNQTQPQIQHFAIIW